MNGWKRIAFSVALNLSVIAAVFRVKMLRDFVLGSNGPKRATELNSAQELKIATIGTLETKGRSTQGMSYRGK